MDRIRALNALMEIGDVDKNRISITGSSQGDGLTLVTTALGKDVALSLPGCTLNIKTVFLLGGMNLLRAA